MNQPEPIRNQSGTAVRGRRAKYNKSRKVDTLLPLLFLGICGLKIVSFDSVGIFAPTICRFIALDPGLRNIDFSYIYGVKR